MCLYWLGRGLILHTEDLDHDRCAIHDTAKHLASLKTRPTPFSTKRRKLQSHAARFEHSEQYDRGGRHAQRSLEPVASTFHSRRGTGVGRSLNKSNCTTGMLR
jgi:hypothetical protein